jgi:charged multivesicular body protein 6
MGNVLKNLFGTKAKRDSSKQPTQPAITSHDEAVLSLKRQRDRLHRLTLQAEAMMKAEEQAAKHHISLNQKDRAIYALRRKRLKQTSINQIQANLSNIDTMLLNIETAQLNIAVFDALKKGTNALNELNAQLTVEDVESLMDESAEALAHQQRVSDALAQSLTPTDEQATMDELNEMQASIDAELANQINDLPITTNQSTDQTSNITTVATPESKRVVVLE